MNWRKLTPQVRYRGKFPLLKTAVKQFLPMELFYQIPNWAGKNKKNSRQKNEREKANSKKQKMKSHFSKTETEKLIFKWHWKKYILTPWNVRNFQPSELRTNSVLKNCTKNGENLPNNIFYKIKRQERKECIPWQHSFLSCSFIIFFAVFQTKHTNILQIKNKIPIFHFPYRTQLLHPDLYDFLSLFRYCWSKYFQHPSSHVQVAPHIPHLRYSLRE